MPSSTSPAHRHPRPSLDHTHGRGLAERSKSRSGCCLAGAVESSTSSARASKKHDGAHVSRPVTFRPNPIATHRSSLPVTGVTNTLLIVFLKLLIVFPLKVWPLLVLAAAHLDFGGGPQRRTLVRLIAQRVWRVLVSVSARSWFLRRVANSGIVKWILSTSTFRSGVRCVPALLEQVFRFYALSELAWFCYHRWKQNQLNSIPIKTAKIPTKTAILLLKKNLAVVSRLFGNGPPKGKNSTLSFPHEDQRFRSGEAFLRSSMAGAAVDAVPLALRPRHHDLASTLPTETRVASEAASMPSSVSSSLVATPKDFEVVDDLPCSLDIFRSGILDSGCPPGRAGSSSCSSLDGGLHEETALTREYSLVRVVQTDVDCENQRAEQVFSLSDADRLETIRMHLCGWFRYREEPKGLIDVLRRNFYLTPDESTVDFAALCADNVREFLAWLYLVDVPSSSNRALLDEMLNYYEIACGTTFPPGYNPALVSMRPTFERIRAAPRPLFLYGVSCALLPLLADGALLKRQGFREFASGSLRYFVRTGKHCSSFRTTADERGSDLVLPSPNDDDTSSSSSEKPVEQADTSTPSKCPIVFVCGIGVGSAGYAPFLLDLVKTYPDRKIFFLALPHVSMRMSETGMSPAEVVACIVDMLATHSSAYYESPGNLSEGDFVCEADVEDVVDSTESKVVNGSGRTTSGRRRGKTSHRSDGAACGAHFVGQSFGTIVMSWVIRRRPDLVQFATFIDPACFLLSQSDLVFNMLYRSPRTWIQLLLKYFFAQELHLVHSLQRKFFWDQSILWASNLRFPTNVVLCGLDSLLPAQSVRQYLAKERQQRLEAVTRARLSGKGRDESCVRANFAPLEIIFFPNLGHGEWVQRPDARPGCRRIVSAIGELERGGYYWRHEVEG